MKNLSHLLLLTAAALAPLLASPLCAQTADQLVIEGRTFLSGRNITNANAKFGAALAVNPNHEAANVLHAATRVLNLPLQPVGAAFLTRLGFPTPGRDIYNWTARTAKDTNGIPVAPAGVNAQELTFQLRTNALPEIQGALQSLARITNPNFSLSLTAAETTGDAVTLDHADVLVLRAALHFVEYLCHTLHAQNLDAQLTALRALYTNSSFSVEALLTQYPALFSYNTTNDLAAAQAAFVNMVDRYNEASDKMRLRMALTRLFNLDDGSLGKEINFRTTVNELRQSLSGGPVALSGDNVDPGQQFLVDLKPHFSGTNSLRSQLPRFQGGRIVLGTLPEPVLGGSLPAFGRDQVEDYLLKDVTYSLRWRIPQFNAISKLTEPMTTATGFSLGLRGVEGRGYAVQFNTNLTNAAGWLDVGGSFYAESTSMRLEDADSAGAARRFYRVVERGSLLPPPVNNNFANRTVLTGFPVMARGYTGGASSEAGEPPNSNGRGRTVWWSWTATFTGSLAIFTDAPHQLYTGSSLPTLSEVSAIFVGQFQVFPVQGGTVYSIRVDDYYFASSPPKGFPVVLTSPMAVSVAGVTSGSSLVAPANLTITATVTSPASAVTEVGFNGVSRAVSKNPPYTLSLTNLLPGNYYLSTKAENQQGIFARSYINFSVTGPVPPNDNFANRIVLTGATVVGESYTGGATTEAGEPPYGGISKSVWWEWVAPKSGLVSLSTKNASGAQAVAVFTGTALGSLTRIGIPVYFDSDNEKRLRFIAMAGTSYKIAVVGGSTSGFIRISLNQP